MNFCKKLRKIQSNNNSLLCIGLDSDVVKMPAKLRRMRNPQFEFNRKIVESTQDLVCAYKLNLAFYEVAGKRGYETVHRTLECIPENTLTICDGKRGDIGNTAEQYANLIFTDWKFDAATVNPYMGKDSIAPFIKDENRFAFILALTSNPGSGDFQYLEVKGRPLYEHVIAKSLKWNEKNNIGFVVGASHPGELRRIRSMTPGIPLLIPGIGAQKGDIESTVRFGCNGSSQLALINISRAIIYASMGEDFAEKARLAALKFNDQFNYYRSRFFR